MVLPFGNVAGTECFAPAPSIRLSCPLTLRKQAVHLDPQCPQGEVCNSWRPQPLVLRAPQVLSRGVAHVRWEGRPGNTSGRRYSGSCGQVFYRLAFNVGERFFFFSK